MERRYDAIGRVFAGLSTLCAEQPKTQGARVCAGLVYKRRVIAVGTNLDRSDPWQKRFGTTPMNIYLHAETMAIKRGLALVGEDVVMNSSLFVCRLRQVVNQKTGNRVFEWGLSKPCLGCQRAIDTYRIKRVYYTLGPDTYATWLRHASRTLHHDLNSIDADIFGISQVGTH